MRISMVGLGLLWCVALVASRPQEGIPARGDGAGFEMLDQPQISDAIYSLSKIPGLNINATLLASLPADVIYTLLKNLANSGYMQQKAPEENTRVNVVEPVEVCPDSDKNGIPYYCKDMPDGMYHDPWNPWCGYVECAGGVAKRRVCKRGRWMDTKSRLGKTQKDLCQMPITRSYSVAEPCSMWTDMDMCRNAAKVETQSAPAEEA